MFGHWQTKVIPRGRGGDRVIAPLTRQKHLTEAVRIPEYDCQRASFRIESGVPIYDPALPVSFHCPSCKKRYQVRGGLAEQQTPRELLPQFPTSLGQFACPNEERPDFGRGVTAGRDVGRGQCCEELQFPVVARTRLLERA